MSDTRTHAPPDFWIFMQRCHEAGRLLPLPPDLADMAIKVDGKWKPIPEMTPDDLDRLVEAERERITTDTLIRLDFADGILDGGGRDG